MAFKISLLMKCSYYLMLNICRYCKSCICTFLSSPRLNSGCVCSIKQSTKVV